MNAMPVSLKALQRRLTALVDDLREQSEALPALKTRLEEEYKAAYAARRTGGTYEAWRADGGVDAAVQAGSMALRGASPSPKMSGIGRPRLAGVAGLASSTAGARARLAAWRPDVKNLRGIACCRPTLVSCVHRCMPAGSR